MLQGILECMFRQNNYKHLTKIPQSLSNYHLYFLDQHTTLQFWIRK